MAHWNALSEYGKGLDIKHEGKIVEYNPDWVRKELNRTPQGINLPKHVLNTLQNGWYSTLSTRFDAFKTGKFIERLIIAAVIPDGDSYGSNCFGTSLFLGGFIPSDILVDGKSDVGKGCPGIEDYLKRFRRVDSLEGDAIIAYYDKGKIYHSVFYENERKEFFDRTGLWRPLQGCKSMPKSNSLDVIFYDASTNLNFDDLFPLSLKDARDCIDSSHSYDE
jgi:hypothetical protein